MSDIYLSLTETPTVVTLSQPVVSGVLSSNVTVTNVVSVNVVTMPAINVTAAAPSVTTVAGTVAVSNFPASSSVTIGGFSTSSLPPSTVTVGNTVTINGTVTASLRASAPIGVEGTPPTIGIALGYGTDSNQFFNNVTEDLGFPVRITAQSQTQPISGTVTANVIGTRAFVDSNAVTVSGFLAVGGWDDVNSQHAPIPLIDGGTGIRIGFDDVNGAPLQVTNHPSLPLSATVTIGNSVTIGSLPAISGTVTANSIFPRVTLIDGSGTVATANTAITVFASSSTRSYLLVQVTTGSAFVNVGATATTVNGINLTAGQGYSWETTIPQGIVSLISTTTNSRYVAKEA